MADPRTVGPDDLETESLEVVPARHGIQLTGTEPTRPESTGQGGAHEAPDGAPRHPLIDLSRDPHPGQPDHARADED